MIPMLAEQAEPRQVLSGLFIKSDRWIVQPKVDGDRRLIVCDGRGGIEVLGRDGQVTHLPSAIAKLLAKINMPVVLDGELLAGRLFIWDVPRCGTQVTETTPCIERVTIAYGIAKMINSDLVQAVPTAVDPAAKIAMVEKVLAGDGEGVMAKLAASPYVQKRSRAWRKVKVLHEVDCVVDWLGTEKANMGLYLYNAAGDKIPVGEVGRGSADGERVREGDVVTVRVVHVSDDDRLVQPTLPRRRTDKAPADCTTAQLAAARTNKNLLVNWRNAA